MTTHSRILACRIPWTEESGGLRSLGSQKGSDMTATEQQRLCSGPREYGDFSEMVWGFSALGLGSIQSSILFLHVFVCQMTTVILLEVRGHFGQTEAEPAGSLLSLRL